MMFLAELNSDLKTIKGLGPQAQRSLFRLGIMDVKGLLCHYPRDWEDRTRVVPLCDWNRARVCTTVRVLSHEWFGAGYMKTLKINIEDDADESSGASVRASLICFNRPFLAKQFPVGSRVRILGHFHYKYNEVQSSSFEFADVKDSSFGRILPIYPLCEGITQFMLRRFIDNAIGLYSSSFEDELPEFIIKKEELLSKADAIRAIHFPSSFEERDRARRTLIFEELFYMEMMTVSRILERKKIRSDLDSCIKKEMDCAADNVNGNYSPLQKRLIERLPFSLTPGQIETSKEIILDMDSHYPMARLLQGDVGSGKTLVAFLACLKAVDKGAQAALMAPTELLARQHAETAAKLLEPLGLRIAFLTGNLKASGRSRLLSALAAGEIDVVAGTHALFSRDTIYKNLKLVIVDEQHRFGVTQRKAIMAKGDYPNLLMMSATPIPRTLALTVFGDLDVSVISDMPPGRKPVKTHLSKTSNAKKVYDFVKKELARGHQAYFVYPLIETSAAGLQDLKDAQTMAKKLQEQVFPQYPVALIHSRLDEEEKQGTMEDFRKGKIKVLAATSVVEVGVDVANATCMVVEHAERFGLAALHQLRGRVGRGEDQSYCFLIYSDQEVPDEYAGINPGLLSDEERSKEGRRLMVMLENNDGFVIAEKDLLFRGPGQITGFQQSGYLKLGIADPLRDTEELERARQYAFAVLESDPGFERQEHLCIKEIMKRTPLFGEVVF